MTYYAVVTRARHGRVRVVEFLDVVLTASPDAAKDGVWEVSMADELFFEVLTTSVPTAADVEDMLRQRRGEYAADVGWTPAFQSLPRVWVRRSMAGHEAMTSLVTTVRGHRLHEVQVDDYAIGGVARSAATGDEPRRVAHDVGGRRASADALARRWNLPCHGPDRPVECRSLDPSVRG